MHRGGGKTSPITASFCHIRVSMLNVHKSFSRFFPSWLQSQITREIILAISGGVQEIHTLQTMRCGSRKATA
jgi:hypothetical protein